MEVRQERGSPCPLLSQSAREEGECVRQSTSSPTRPELPKAGRKASTIGLGGPRGADMSPVPISVGVLCRFELCSPCSGGPSAPWE